MFGINDKEIIEFEKDLKTFASRAYPFATKNTVNTSAFNAQKIAERNIANKMVLRNKFTLRSIKVDQTKTLNVGNQISVIGSTLEYMEDQEFGAIKNKRGVKGVSIPTGYSAGQQGQNPRTRLPRRLNKMANIKLKRSRRQGSNRKQQNLIAIKQASGTGNKYVYLDLGKTQGIFKVVGGKRKPKIKMVHDLSRDSVTIPSNPWLKPAFDAAVLLLPDLYKQSLIFQLKEQRLFRS